MIHITVSDSTRDSRDTTKPEGDVRSQSLGECRFNSSHGAASHTYGHGLRDDGTEDPRLYWVNGYPVTAMRLGIDKFAAEVFSNLGNNLKPELALSGINVGVNTDGVVSRSGTVGAARFAVQRQIPAISLSGAFPNATAWNDRRDSPALESARTYASLSTSLAIQLIGAAGETNPILPPGVFLNVNFPNADPSTGCDDWRTKFKWVLSYTKSTSNTIAPLVPHRCARVPSEAEVLSPANQRKCLFSISVTNAEDFTPGSLDAYETVLKRLERWGTSTCF